MNYQKPIFWHDGLFLQPQHLQYQDAFHFSQYHPLRRIAAPYFWGVVDLRINEGALNHENFEVHSGSFLFPEGGLVSFPENAVLPSRNYGRAWEDRQKPFFVYIGLKRMDPGGNNVSVVSGEAQGHAAKTRFFTTPDPVSMKDLYGDGPEAQVAPLTYVLKIFFEKEIEEARNYETMPVACLEQDGEEIRLSSDYAPPCLHLSSSPMLLRTVMAIRDELAGRVRQLEEYKTPVGEQNVEIDTRSIPYRMTLMLLSQYTPSLFHMVDTLQVHPFAVYGVLRQIIGGISFLTEEVNFLGENREGESLVPPYIHTEPGRCFSRAHALIVRILNQITIGAELLVHVPYHREQGMYMEDIPEQFFEKGHVYYLSLFSETPVEEFQENFLQFAKMGSKKAVTDFIEHALPGMKVTPLKMRPEGIPRRPNASYFRIDQRAPQWEDIRRTKSFAMIWEAAPEDLRVELIGLRR